MLRLGTVDISGDGPALPMVSPSLVTRALGDLAMGRLSAAGAGYAIEQFCATLIEDTPRSALGFVDRLIDCGVTVDAIYDTYIPRAAARLGEMWNEDILSFTAVTLGMARLTEVFRRLSPTFLKQRQSGRLSQKHALFALAPGETHSLGVVMAADYFQRNGWIVRVELRSDNAGLERIVREQPFDMIGVSAGSRCLIPDLSRTIARLRKAAGSSTQFVLGGPLGRLVDGLADRIGVNVVPGSAAEALSEVENRM